MAAVIDLRLLREDPDLVRASQRARGEDAALVDALLDGRRGAGGPRCRRPTSCAPSRRRSASRSRRRARTSGRRCSSAAKELAAEVKAAEAAQADADDGAAPRRTWPIANVVEDGVPAGGEDDYVVLETSASRPASTSSRGPPRARRGARRHRHGARRQGLRRRGSTSSPASARGWSSALLNWPMRPGRRRTASRR